MPTDEATHGDHESAATQAEPKAVGSDESGARPEVPKKTRSRSRSKTSGRRANRERSRTPAATTERVEAVSEPASDAKTDGHPSGGIPKGGDTLRVSVAPPPEPPAPAEMSRGARAKSGEPAPSEAPSRETSESRLPAVSLAPEPIRGEKDPARLEARRWIGVYKDELRLRPDSQRAARLHYEIGRLQEQRLEDTRRAAVSYLHAHKALPEHRPALRAARRLLLARKEFRTALPLFDAEVRISPEPRDKAALLCAKGRVLEDSLNDRAGAKRAYQAARDLDASNPHILKALEQCQLEPEDWRELSRTYEQCANAVATDPHHRSALIVRRARLAELHRNPGQATEMYETALRVDPGSAEALNALKRLFSELERWRDLARVLEQAAGQTTDPKTRTLHRYLAARLYARRLGSPSEAITVLERAVVDAPTDPLLLQELERLHAAQGDESRLREVLTRQLRASTDDAERLSLLHRLGELAERLDEDPGQASELYEQARQLAPTHLPTLHALQRLYRQHRQWELLLQTLGAELQATTDTTRQAAVHAELAQILERHAEQSEAALVHHQRALSLDPDAQTSFRALERLLPAAGRTSELVSLYEQGLDHAQGDSARKALLLKLATTLETTLEDPAAAADAFRRLLALDPDEPLAMHGLARTAERSGRYEELLHALETEAARTSDPNAKLALLERVAQVLADEMEEPEGALARLREAARLAPGHLPILRSLGRLYERLGHYEDLLEVYRTQAELLPPGDERAALLLTMVELCDKRIGDRAQGLELLREAVRLAPERALARRSLATRLGEHGQWQELIALLEGELETGQDTDNRALAAYRIGEVYETQLDAPTKALSFYSKALELVPTHPFAAEASARLNTLASAWRPLVEDLERQAQAATDPGFKIAALMRQGQLWADQLREPQRAIACFEAALKERPSLVDALLALEPLYRTTGNYRALAHTYASLAEVLTAAPARATALRELARLQRQRGLGDVEDQKRVYEAIIALSPDDPAVQAGFEDLLLRVNDQEAVQRLDRQLAEQQGDPTVGAAALLRLGETLSPEQAAEALQLYQRALELEPASVGAVRGLERAAEQLNDTRQLLEAKQREAAMTQNPERAADLLLRGAALCAEQLDDTERAVEVLQSALERCPEHVGAANRLKQLLSASEHSVRLVEILSRAAKLARNPERAGRLWYDVAQLENERHANVAAAISALNRALQSVPNDVETLAAMAHLFQLEGQWTEAVNLLERVVQLAPQRRMLRDAHLQLAELYEVRMGDAHRALSSLQAALGLDGNSRAALWGLARLQRREGTLEPAAASAGSLVRLCEESDEKLKALLLLAEIEQERGDAAAAERALLTAVEQHGPEGKAAKRVKQLLGTTGHWPAYRRALQAHAEREAGAARAYAELVWLETEHLDGEQAAMRTARQGLERHPEAPELHMLLASLLRKTGDRQAAVAQLNEGLGHCPHHSGQWRELARCLDELKEPNEACAALLGLVVLRNASEQERERTRRWQARTAQARAETLRMEVLEHLGPAWPELGVLPALLRALRPALPKLFPPDLDSFGVSVRDRITARAGHPVRELADRLAAIFGVRDFDLFAHRVRGRGIAIELGDGPAVLVPEALEKLPYAQQTFLLARPLAMIAEGTHPLLKLNPLQLGQLFRAAAWPLKRERNAQPKADEAQVEELSKQLGRALGWRGRKTLEPLLAELAPMPQLGAAFDPTPWLNASRARANRAALLATDDLVQAVEAYRTAEPTFRSSRGQKLAKKSPVVADLLGFWASEAARSFRLRAYDD